MRADAQRDELVAWWLDQRDDIRPDDVCEVRGDVLALLLDRWTRTQPDREPARK